MPSGSCSTAIFATVILPMFLSRLDQESQIPRRRDSKLENNWIKVRTIGTKSNRSGIGARLICVTRVSGESKPHRQIDEVRSGGSYISQNDFRIHFGLGKAEKVDVLEIRWPSGQVDTIKDIKANQLVYVKEGEGITRTMQFSKNSKASR